MAFKFFFTYGLLFKRRHKKKRGRIAVVEACKGRVTNPWNLDGPI